MPETKIRLAAGTDVGLIRKNNEDNFVVNGNLKENDWIIPKSSEQISLGKFGCLLVVADGMGGTNAGEVASSIAIETIQEKFSSEELEKLLGDKIDTLSEDVIRKFMSDTIKAADLNIINRSKLDSSTQGMGTTVVMLWLLNEMAYVSWCGDSRCYLFNAEYGISRLSKDHSYVQELVDDGKLDPENAFDHPYSNIITRCLGDQENRAIPDFRSCQLSNDDVFLLCSDGLCGLCRDEEIMQIMTEHKDSVTACKNALIDAALSAGGYDNVTVALCQIETEKMPESADLSHTVLPRKKKHTENFFFGLLLLLVGLCIIAIIIFKFKNN